MLSDRRQQVLTALIKEYVSHALPVGSRTLVENYSLGVSSATVRNELSALEEGGYITQPHTSAGRIPTDWGYRAFVDELLATELGAEEADESRLERAAKARQYAAEADDLLQQTTQVLANLTECLSIVVPPSTLMLHIRQISLVSITPYRALIVIVSENGQVANRQVDFDREVSTADLATAQSAINELLVGKSLTEMREDLEEGKLAQLADPLCRLMLEEVLVCLQSGDAGQSYRLGLSTLLQQPEFTHSQALLPILQTLEDETVLLQLIDATDGADGTVVRIGSENDNELLNGVSVIASQYGSGAATGVVAVIGPTRMDYAKVIRAVRDARNALKDE